MKTLLIALCLLCLIACKKSSPNPEADSAELKIQISNLGPYTDYLIAVSTDVATTPNQRFNGKKDTTIGVVANHKQKFSILYNFTALTPGTNGESGTGVAKFFYKGQQIGSVANGSGNTTVSIP